MFEWWLVTWTTHSSWLPGDPRGFRTWRKTEYVPPPKGRALGGELTYNPKDYAARHVRAKEISASAVRLRPEHLSIVESAIVDEISQLAIEPAILSVDRTHVHLIARFGDCRIRPTAGRLKAAATRALHENGFQTERAWTRNCHMESLPHREAFENAFEYVRGHLKDAAKVHIWKSEMFEE